MLRRSDVSKRKAEDAGSVRGSNAGAKFRSEQKEIKTHELPEVVSQELPKRNFNSLPMDVVLMIFKYLDTDEIASSVLPVCKTWYQVGRNPILLKKIKMNGILSTFRANALIVVIQRAVLLRSLILNNTDELESLDISDTGEVSNILECVAKNCPLLSILHLSHCKVNCVGAVQSLVSSCPCLKRLRLVCVTGSALQKFTELTTLVELKVSQNTDMGDFFTRLSQNNRQLETVKLLNSEVCTDEQLVPLLTNLKSVIKIIELTALHCGSPTYRAVAECSNLQSIHLLCAEHLLDPELKAMENLQKLKRIHIEHPSFCGHDISSNAWKSFITNVSSDHIECVSFHWCKNVTSILEEVLSSCDDTILHKANSVNLSSSGTISDRVVELIIKGNPFLKTLRLCYSSGFKGLAFNTTDANIAPALRYLDVDGCKQVRLPYLRTFLKNRLGLQIIGPDGEEMKR